MSKHDGKPVAIIMAFDSAYLPVARVTVPVLKRYADRHNYVLHGGEGYYQEDPSNLRDYGDRSKIDMYCQLYDDHDIVMFLDTDALIMNHDIKIEDVLAGGNAQCGYTSLLGERPFLWSHDPGGPCSGFWIARCIPLVKQTLLEVQRLAQVRGNLVVKENLGPPHSVTLNMEPRGTSDQTTMRSIMHLPPFNQVLGNCVSLKQAQHCYDDFSRYGWQGLESMGQYEPGDWICTAPGVPMDEKVEILKRFAEKAG